MEAGDPPPQDSLRDVAVRLNVSLKTVSRAINRPETVARATRERIHTALEETGYVPNLLARSLVSRRSRLVAALIPPVADASFLATVETLSRRLSEAKYRLLVGHGGGSPEFEAGVGEMLLGHQPEALVLTGITHHPRLIKRLRARHVRVVEMWNLGDEPVDLMVGFSNRRAARDLTRAVITAGRRRIGFIGPPPLISDRARDRRAGFVDALRESGLAAIPSHLIETSPGFEGGAEGLARLLGQPEPVDAVVITGEALASGALLEALARDVNIPESLLVAAFGRMPATIVERYGLTTCAIDGPAIGNSIADKLLPLLSLNEEPASPTSDVGYSIVSPRSH